MAAFLGSLQLYDPKTDWQLDELSLTEFFAASDIENPTNANDPDRRKSSLLANIRMRALEIIRSPCAAANPSTNTNDQLIKLLRKIYVKAPTKSLARKTHIKNTKREQND